MNLHAECFLWQQMAGLNFVSRQPFPVQIVIDRKQLDNLEFFNYLGSMVTDNARCTCRIKTRIAMAKQVFNSIDSFHQQIGLKCKEETSEVLHLEQSIVWF
jgi:hypothetical protein